MQEDTNTKIVFALEGSYEYHNGLMIRYQPTEIFFKSKIAIPIGQSVVVKMMEFCSILNGQVHSCEPYSSPGDRLFFVGLLLD